MHFEQSSLKSYPVVLGLNPTQAGGGAFDAPPSFIAIALSFLTLSPLNLFTFDEQIFKGFFFEIPFLKHRVEYSI